MKILCCALYIVLLCSFIHLITANKEIESDRFSFEPLNNSVGLYFEKISKIYLFNNEWHIVFHINLTTIFAEFENVEQTVDHLDNFCHNYTRDFTKNFTHMHKSRFLERSCGGVLSEIKLMMSNIKDFSADWFHSNKRQKRGAFNIVGNILNSLFGTLSQEDAEVYLSRMEQMEENERETKLIVDEQTTLMKSTAEILEKYNQDYTQLYDEVSNLYKALNQTFERLNMNYENIWYNLELQSQLENLLLFISLLLTSFSNKQHKFLEALSLLSNKHSQNPIVLPPKFFISELSKIESHIQKKNLKLPLEINRDTLPYFYQIASTRSRVLDDQLLICMSIPLVALDEYELIKVTSFPHKIANDLYSFILPEHEYIAVDSNREKFISLSNQELENCYDLRYRSEDQHLICMQSSPIIKISPTRDDCSLIFLTENPEIHNCNVRVSNFSSQLWLKLKEINAWIYAFPTPEVISIRCDNLSIVQKLVEGTGIIRIKQDCHIKTNDYLIEAHTVFSSDIYEEIHPAFTPVFDFNLTNYIEEFRNELKFKGLQSPQIISFGESNKLKQLSNGIEELQAFRRTKIAQKMKEHHNFITLLLSVFSISIPIVLLIVYCILKAKKCYYKRKTNKIKNQDEIELDSYSI